MDNPSTLFMIRKLQSGIKTQIAEAASMVKEATDIEALMDAKIINHENIDYYENLHDIYVKVNFGNNIILPFCIDCNIATCLKVETPKEDREITLKSLTALKEIFGMKKKDSINDLAEEIKARYGFEIKLDVKKGETRLVSSRKSNLNDAMISNQGSVWEASLKKFVGELTEIGSNPEELAQSSDSLKKVKKISSVLEMMENKQKALIEKKGLEENQFISQTISSDGFVFNEESEKKFLDLLETKFPEDYKELTKEKGIDEARLKMVGIYHLQEIKEISPQIQSLLDREISNKVNYKVKLLKEEQENPKEEKQEMQNFAQIDGEESYDFGEEPLEDYDDDLEYGSISQGF